MRHLAYDREGVKKGLLGCGKFLANLACVSLMIPFSSHISINITYSFRNRVIFIINIDFEYGISTKT